jgi:hypothetical protein
MIICFWLAIGPPPDCPRPSRARCFPASAPPGWRSPAQRIEPPRGRRRQKIRGKAIETPRQCTIVFAEHDTKRGKRAVKNPLESLSHTVLAGVILTVIMVAVLAAIA